MRNARPLLSASLLLVLGCSSKPSQAAQGSASSVATASATASARGADSARAAALKDAHDFGANGALSAIKIDPDDVADAAGTDEGPLSNGLRARVRTGAISVSGGLTPTVIEHVVSRKIPHVRRCFRHALSSNPKLMGTVTASFIVGTDGKVSDAQASGSLPDEDVKACVVGGVSSVVFPSTDGVVKITYPIAFSTDDDSKNTVNGKLLADARPDDLKAALEKAGCTEVTQKPYAAGETSPTMFTLKKSDKTCEVTFVAASDPPPFTWDERQAFEHDHAVFDDPNGNGALIAIQCDADPSKQAAETLSRALVVRHF